LAARDVAATGRRPVTDEVCRQYIKHMEALICAVCEGAK